MKFRVGTKVKPTKELLSSLSDALANRIRDGGTIIKEESYGFRIQFYSGKIYVLTASQLIPLLAKNQQLLFEFME